MTDSLGNRVVEIDGVDIRSEVFNIASRTGRYQMPKQRGEALVLPGASGATFVPNRPYEVGAGALSVWAIGATPSGNSFTVPATARLRQQALEDNIAGIMRFFSRPHKLSTIRSEQPDGTYRRAQVEWKEWENPTIEAGGTVATWGVSYEIPKTWWEDDSTTTQATTANATLPKTLSLTSFANMTGIIEDPIIKVYGPITNPVVTDMETGSWVKYTGTLTNLDTWTLDAGAWTSKVNSTGVLDRTTHGGGYRLFVVPNCYGATNTPSIKLEGTSGGATTKLELVARRKWTFG